MRSRRISLLLVASFAPFVAGGGNCGMPRQMREAKVENELHQLRRENQRQSEEQQFLERRIEGLEEALQKRQKREQGEGSDSSGGTR